MPVVSAVTGPSTVSISGAPITLADATLGGVWTSSNMARATIGSLTGIVTGVSSGMVTISYSVTNGAGCVGVATKNVTVGPAPPPHSTGLDGASGTNLANLLLIPNPNKGTFTIKGNLASSNDAEVTMMVTDVLGQVIYRNKVNVIEGAINEQVLLANNLSNGMYILQLYSSGESLAIHFVIEQ